MEKMKPTNFIWFLNLIPIVAFFLFISKYAVNVPYMDDMELVDTVNELKENVARLPSILVRQQNDHRTMFPRLGILLTYWIRGTLDFRATVLAGFLNLTLMGGSFLLIYRKIGKNYLWFLPVTILLFSPIIYQDHLWSMTAYQYTLAIAFSILALYFVQSSKRQYWYYTMPFSIAATLTNLDGLGVLPLVLFWLLNQRRWKHSLAYFSFASLYLLLYFTNFKFSSASKLPLTVDGFYMMAQSFVVLTGSIAKVISDTYGVVLSLIAGSVILITYLYLKIALSLSVPRFMRSGKGLLHFTLADMCFLKILASMAMIALGRSADGAEGMMAIRFQIYSVSVLILFYLFVLEKTEGKTRVGARYSFLLLAVVLNVTSYAKYDTAVNYFSSGLRADTYNYATKGVFLHQYFNLPDPEPKFYRNYVFPVFFNEKLIETWKRGGSGNKGSIDLEVAGIENKGAYSHYLQPLIEFAVEADKFESSDEEMFLCVFQTSSTQKPYIVALKKKNRTLYQWLKGNESPKFLHGNIPHKLPTGTYQANLCWIEDGVPGSIKLSDSLSL